MLSIRITSSVTISFKTPVTIFPLRVSSHNNPVNQIVGYIMSGDPTYITSHKNARSLIMKVERDEILEELLSVYIDARLK